MASNSDSWRWYVKVSGQIRSHSSVEIIQSLVSGAMNVNTQVSRDRENWCAICNEPFFEDYIQNLIRDLSTQATSTGEDSPSKTNLDESSGLFDTDSLREQISHQLAHAKKLSELSVNVNALRRILISIATNRKIVAVVKSAKVEQVNPLDQDDITHDQKPNPFAVLRDWRFLSIIGFVLVLQAGKMGFDHLANLEREKHLKKIQAQSEEAIQAKISGDYAKALASFGAIESEVTDPRTLLEMAEAQIASNDLNKGRDLAQRALKVAASAPERARARGLLGLIAMRERNIDIAKIELEASLREETDLFSALHNLGVLHLSRGEFEMGETLLLKALQVKGERPLATVLALAEVAIQIDTEPFNRINAVDKILSETPKTNDDTLEKVSLMRILLAQKRNELLDLRLRQEEFLALNPTLPAKVSKTLDRDESRSEWDHLSNLCAQSYADQRESALANAMVARCLLRTREPAKAEPYARFAFASRPQDPLTRGLYAYVLTVLNQSPKAKAILDLVPAESRSGLELIALARACEKLSDTDCAMDAWKKFREGATGTRQTASDPSRSRPSPQVKPGRQPSVR